MVKVKEDAVIKEIEDGIGKGLRFKIRR